MPLTHGSVGGIHSSDSEENMAILETEQPLDDDCGLSDYETESGDSLCEAQTDDIPPPERQPLVGNSGISAVADSDVTFRARLDADLKYYQNAKKQFLLSITHDDKSTKYDDEENKLDQVYALFGNEIIILRALDDDPKVKSGTKPQVGKKSKRDRSLRVKSRSRTNSRESSTLDVSEQNDRRRTKSENVHDLQPHAQEPALLAVDVDERTQQQEERPLNKDVTNPLIDYSQFEERLSPEEEAERERRAKLRKLYRWERYRFGRFALGAKSLDQETVLTRLLGTKNEISILQKNVVSKEKLRESIGDSLFKDDSRTNVCYIDSKDDGLDQRITPIVTSFNYQAVIMSEASVERKPSEDVKKVALPVRGDAKMSDITNTPAGRGDVDELKTEKVASEDVKKGKKDKKKKKRKDSSSSDDLEELERKSEARLGKRK